MTKKNEKEKNNKPLNSDENEEIKISFGEN